MPDARRSGLGTKRTPPPARPGGHGRHRPRTGHRGFLILSLLAVVALLLGGAVMMHGRAFPRLSRDLQGNQASADDQAARAAREQPAPADRAARPAAPPASSAVSPTPAAVLSLPGKFPATGPGIFRFANSRGEVLGGAGTLLRFRVGIEDGVDEGVAAFAGTIDQTLGDARSWIGSRQLRLQRVPPGSSTDFTIYLATAETARRMCGQAGVDIVENGEAYTSCRAPGKVVLNLNRWRLSVPEYVSSRIPLQTYRQYVINHEVGHELGHGHELCPGGGQAAPVMQQQTLGLHGCTANAWPYLNGKRYAGQPGEV